ncbi:MAG: porin family protein [Flavobacteriales bacterium]
MKKIFSFIFLCVAIQMTAQDSLRFFRFGVSTGIGWCNRLSTAEGTVSSMKEEFDKLEKGIPGYCAGLSIQYVISKRWFVQSGLQYCASGYRIDTLPGTGLIDMQYRYNYLELPLRLHCVLGHSRKIHPVAALGMSARFLLKQRTDFLREGISMEYSFDEFESSEKFGYTINAGLGFEKLLYKNVQLNCIVLLSQAISPIADTPLKRYLNNVGISASLNWNF